MGHSREVYEDTANFFNEVFGGYSVPMDPYMCPFHANNLAYIRDSQQLANWHQAKISSNNRVTCPICGKTFKSIDFFQLHLKTHHSNPDLQGYRYQLGQENKLTREEHDGISNQGRQVCLADYCDIVPCHFHSLPGVVSPKTKTKITLELANNEKARMRTTTFRHRYNPQRDLSAKLEKNQWRGLDHGMAREKMDLLEQKCSKMILDCVDWHEIDESKETDKLVKNVGTMYDLLYQVYCAKLTAEGADL